MMVFTPTSMGEVGNTAKNDYSDPRANKLAATACRRLRHEHEFVTRGINPGRGKLRSRFSKSDHFN
jgi:hypothetical protein